jgi:hypothetical protein
MCKLNVLLKVVAKREIRMKDINKVAGFKGGSELTTFVTPFARRQN